MDRHRNTYRANKRVTYFDVLFVRSSPIFIFVCFQSRLFPQGKESVLFSYTDTNKDQRDNEGRKPRNQKQYFGTEYISPRNSATKKIITSLSR